jgi:hypothetical protein
MYSTIIEIRKVAHHCKWDELLYWVDYKWVEKEVTEAFVEEISGLKL